METHRFTVSVNCHLPKDEVTDALQGTRRRSVLARIAVWRT